MGSVGGASQMCMATPEELADLAYEEWDFWQKVADVAGLALAGAAIIAGVVAAAPAVAIGIGLVSAAIGIAAAVSHFKEASGRDSMGDHGGADSSRNSGYWSAGGAALDLVGVGLAAKGAKAAKVTKEAGKALDNAAVKQAEASIKSRQAAKEASKVGKVSKGQKGARESRRVLKEQSKASKEAHKATLNADKARKVRADAMVNEAHVNLAGSANDLVGGGVSVKSSEGTLEEFFAD